MSKTQQLNELFEKWKSARGYVGFKKDGILNEDFFISPRILFICKEPNDKDLNEGDYRKWWEKGLAFRFGLRLGEWAYGLINNFPAYEEFSTPQAHEAFMKTAFMNVKKCGGGARANHVELVEYLNRDLQFLKEQIEIINPTIIVCCLGELRITQLLFKEIPLENWNKSGYEVQFAIWNERTIIDFVHPSVYAPGSMSYVLLEKVFNRIVTWSHENRVNLRII